jgi:hypothetical protein
LPAFRFRWASNPAAITEPSGLEQYLPADQINLSFSDGLLFRRMVAHRRKGRRRAFSGPY